ncbi:Plug domain-containing protein [Paracoccus sp. IB05]|uniref:Plug domain-containing protein n=1 Tax=Paracoccus sp. IB05 TaxID=2779367 RepID=UPI0018E8FB63|nr:Plug domain-containing protein [Paracoccus sp. IB05]MBJ2151613.1 hypothetical protein [Paracoccus sp. IB05]
MIRGAGAGGNAGQLLGTIVLGGTDGPGWNGSADTVFSTPEAVAVIGAGTLRGYKLTTPSDIFKGITGVMSGDGRNFGSLNVNIHGMQGPGAGAGRWRRERCCRLSRLSGQYRSQFRRSRFHRLGHHHQRPLGRPPGDRRRGQGQHCQRE